jgi:hypothetical protein
MYAHNHYAVLICSGHGHIWKDSLIRKFLGNSARGVVVHSLKLPIRQSWNTIICGVTILHYLKREVWYFNRSHENVLLPEHPEYIMYENLPD